MSIFSRLSLESIHFQNDSFGSEMESLIYSLETKVKNVPRLKNDVNFLNSEAKAFNNLIFKRLGLKVDLILNTYCPGAMFVFPVNKHHILLKDYYRGEMGIHEHDKLLSEMNNKEGGIDLVKAKVSGIFSEYEHSMYCDIIGNLESGISVPGVVAIMLHELGHAFTYYEMSDRINSTNQILADLALTVKDKADKSKRKYLFKELSLKLDINANEFDDLIEEDNRVIFGLKLFKKYSLSVGSLMSQAKYDETSSEQLADNFASRFGYGRQLVESLDIIYKISPERNTSMYVITFIVDLLGSVALIFGTIALILGGAIPMGVLLGTFVFIGLSTEGDNDKDMTYDNLKTRYSRIRNQLIEQTSKIELDKTQLKAIIDNIHEIDEIIKGTKDFNSLFNSISNFFYSSNRSAKENIEFQKLLETVAANNLFLKSAELKLI